MGDLVGQAGGRKGVTSVALTVPNILSVAGSPITDAGTLAVTLATQNANLVFAGPSSGGAAAPTFRSLVVGDIPVLDDARLANAVILAPTTSARNVIQPSGAAVIPLTIKGASSQSANLTEWQNSNATKLASVTKDGYFGVGNITPTTFLHLLGTTAPLCIFERPGNANAAFQFKNGSGTINFGLSGANNFGIGPSLNLDTTPYLYVVQSTTFIGIGTASPTTPLHVTVTDATTSTVTNVLTIAHNTSGTPANSYGTGLIFLGQSTTTADRSMGRIRTAWVVATDASRTARITISAFDTAERTVIIMQASGAAAMIGFLGATPITRPTVTGSRGSNAALADLLTQLANLGLITDSTS